MDRQNPRLCENPRANPHHPPPQIPTPFLNEPLPPHRERAATFPPRFSPASSHFLLIEPSPPHLPGELIASSSCRTAPRPSSFSPAASRRPPRDLLHALAATAAAPSLCRAATAPCRTASSSHLRQAAFLHATSSTPLLPPPPRHHCAAPPSPKPQTLVSRIDE